MGVPRGGPHFDLVIHGPAGEDDVLDGSAVDSAGVGELEVDGERLVAVPAGPAEDADADAVVHVPEATGGVLAGAQQEVRGEGVREDVVDGVSVAAHVAEDALVGGVDDADDARLAGDGEERGVGSAGRAPRAREVGLVVVLVLVRLEQAHVSVRLEAIHGRALAPDGGEDVRVVGVHAIHRHAVQVLAVVLPHARRHPKSPGAVAAEARRRVVGILRAPFSTSLRTHRDARRAFPPPRAWGRPCAN